MTAFSERAWTETSDLYRRILDLPFNRELAAGTLSQERFQFYMTQDALYLTQYARALAAASAKAPDVVAMQFFAKAAETREARLRSGFRRAGVDALELATDDDLADAILRFADMRKRRSRLAAGAVLPRLPEPTDDVSLA